MTIKEIISHFVETQTAITKVKSYSDLPGIYAFFFIGKKFPLDNFILPEHKIIYIGKTESSQKSRDANTHFKTGKTGSSTVRKSVGALLSQTEKITPIIRSTSDVEKSKTSHFRFDNSSEIKVTNWMEENLAVAFFEYPESKEKIDTLETLLIKAIEPVLNIDNKNPNNLHKKYIQSLRKELGLQGHTTVVTQSPKTKNIIEQKREKTLYTLDTNLKSGKYISIWNSYLKEIKNALSNGNGKNIILLNKNLFFTAENRKSFAFKLEYNQGKVMNNIEGSAVARDLYKILLDNKIATHKIFRLNKEFELTIE